MDTRLMLLRVLLLLLVAGLAQAQEPLRLRLSTLEWPPYVGRDLPGGGYVQQVVRAALREVGREAKITSYPWARALKLAREGRVDGLFPEYFDPQRRGDFLFSDPIPGGPAGLMKRRDHPYGFAADPLRDPERAFAGLRGLRLGLVRDYLNHPLLDEGDLVTRYYSVDDAQNLKLLLAGRVDLIFIDYKVAEYLIDRHLPQAKGELEPLLPALYRKDLHLIVPRSAADAETKLAAFNEGLRRLRENGELERLMRDFGL
jgi:ABC-type amino acid transport substrate-binding protein